jgi:hypothetical protein
MKYYTLEAIDKLIDRYTALDGIVVTVEEGSLGYGTTLLTGENLKTAIIQERFLNSWSSTHTVRFYNDIPKKYKEAI